MPFIFGMQGHKSKELESGGDSSDVDEASRMVILHLSLEEVLRVACGAADGKNMELQAVDRVNLISLVRPALLYVYVLITLSSLTATQLLSGLTSMLLVVSYFIDTTIAESKFSTLLLALFLLTFSLFCYELMRRGAITDLGTWEAAKVARSNTFSVDLSSELPYTLMCALQLKAAAKAVYLDFSTYHETLKDKLSRGAVDVTAGESSEDTADDKSMIDNRVSLFTPIQDVQEGN